MPFSRSSYIKIIKTSIVTVVVIVIVIYIFLRSLNYIKGPNIDIIEPANGSVIEANSTTLRGQAERISNLFINGNPVTIDEQGNFDKTIGILEGTNIITFEGKDRFGRNTRTVLTLFGKTNK